MEGQSNGKAKLKNKKIFNDFKIIWNGKNNLSKYAVKKKFMFFFWNFIKENNKVKVFYDFNEVVKYIYEHRKV